MKFNPLQKNKEEDFDLIFWIEFFAERYGWTVEETLNLPIPTFYALMQQIDKVETKRAKQRK